MTRRTVQTAVWIGLVAAAFPALAPGAIYTWTENDRWSWLYPQLQILTLQEGDSMWIGPGSDPGEKWIADHVDMTNHGVITWADSNSRMWVGNASDLTNHGLLDLQATGDFWQYAGGAGWNTLTNMPGAILRKSVNNGDVAFSYSNSHTDESQFINFGTLDAQIGRLIYYNPMMHFLDGTLFMGAGSHTIGVSYLTRFVGTISVSPEATLTFDSRIPFGQIAPFSGEGATLHGRACLLAGSLQGTWTLAPDAVLDVVAGGTARQDAAMENRGIIHLHADLVSWGTTLNRGVVEFQDDGINFYHGDGYWPTVTNEGVFRKIAGTGLSTLGTAGQPDLNFYNNPGALVDVQSGILGIYSAAFQANGGEIHVASGAELEVQTYWPNPLVNNGAVHGGGIVRLTGGQPLVNEGSISPGDSLGTLTLTGNFVQEPPGVLTILLAGAVAGQYDRLAVSGQARLGGALLVRAVDGFTAADGTEIAILTCGERVEEFDETVLDLGTGLTGEILYGPTGVSVRIRNAASSVGSPAGSGGLRLSAYAEGGGIAWIMLEMPDAGPARIALFDLGGRRIARLIDGTLGAGTHRWPWNGQADDGRRLAGRGVYFVRAEIDGPGGAKTLRTKLMLRP